MKNDYMVDIVFYGNDLFKEESLTREVSELSEERIFNNNSQYSFLIINDLDGNTELKQSDMKFIKSQLNKSLNIYYLGNSQLYKFMENNLITSNYSETENGIAFIQYYNETIVIRELFTTQNIDNYKELKKILVNSFLNDVILQSN